MATPTPPTASILGRQAEIDDIERFLDAVGGGAARVLLLSGPAGIGKTTLWQAGLEAARARGFLVVTARPAEVETGLAFAALGDLLGPLLDRVSEPLPEPQALALDAALLRAPAASPPQALGVSLAALHVLRSVAADAPLLVAIDDAPWMDDASGRAIAFALRRLEGERVGFLFARRAADPAEPLPDWLSAAPSERTTRLEVAPLTVDETGALLRRHLELNLARPVLAQLHAISGGTPFYSIELGRDLLQRGVWDTPDALEVPRTLDRLVGARIAALTADGDEVALVAAALANPTVGVLELAIGAQRARAGVAEAESAGVLERDGDAIRFSHPLLAASAYARARPDRRRDVHERLAGIVTDPEERARHLARTASGPDPAVAQALEEAAAAALRRGASEDAAQLAEHAARLTPEDASDDRNRRHLLAADDLLISGDMVRADQVLAGLAEALPAGPLLVDVLTRRARVALYLTALDRAQGLLRDALPLTDRDPARRVETLALLAGIGHLTWRDWRPARSDMWEALRLAREIGDVSLHLQMLGHAATWRFGLGRPWRDLMLEADGLTAPADSVPAIEHPDQQFARLLAREGDATEARRRIGRLVERARRSGDWTSLPRLLVSAAGVEMEAGELSRAQELADEAQAGLLQSGEGAFLLDLAIVRLYLAVLRGDVDAVRSAATAMDDEVRHLPKPLVRVGPLLALGLLELSLGNAEAALSWLDRVIAEPGLGRLLPIWWEYAAGMHAEALLGVGRVDEARRAADRLARRARRRGPAAALAESLRVRALVRAASGDADGAVRDAEEAVTIHEGLTLAFRAARAWLTLGEVRRRSRQRLAARSAFETALAAFERIGTPLWAERARSELGRVAGRRPAGSSLTDTERRVAELAGAGHTNKEIAEALFMSVHTVEAHLTRVFRALGVQSRTELARADLGGSAEGATPQP